MNVSRLVLAAFAMASAACHANISFMPGDAFFHSRLTQAVLDRVSADKALVLDYDPPPLSGGLGGYAGFQRIEITDLTKDIVESLTQVYPVLRTHDPKEFRVELAPDGAEVAVETNGFHLFVCRRDADWHEQRFGLKYNENWMELPEEAFVGSNRKSFAEVRAEVYFPFIKDYRAVSEDWKKSRRFSALPVNVPDSVAWGLMHKPIRIPVEISADDVQLVVLRYDDLWMYFTGKRFCDFFCISKGGTVHMSWTKNGLRRLPSGRNSRVTAPGDGDSARGSGDGE